MKKITLSIAAMVFAAFTMFSCNEKKDASATDTSAAAAPVAEVKEEAKPAENPLIGKEIQGIYLNANDLTKEVLTDTLFDEASGFTINATEQKSMEVKSCDPRTIGGELFTQAISTKGSGKFTLGEEALNYRTISFPAKAGDMIIVYTTSSSKTDSRPLHVVNMANAEEIGTISMMPDNGKDMTVDSVTVKEDGNYCVYATQGTGYIYQIKVGK